VADIGFGIEHVAELMLLDKQILVRREIARSLETHVLYEMGGSAQCLVGRSKVHQDVHGRNSETIVWSLTNNSESIGECTGGDGGGWRHILKYGCILKMPSAFIVFSNETRDQVKQDKPNAKFADIGRELGKRWRALSEEEKRKYSKPSSNNNKKSIKQSRKLVPSPAREETSSFNCAKDCVAAPKKQQHNVRTGEWSSLHQLATAQPLLGCCWWLVVIARSSVFRSIYDNN
jgi:hypothetical protein